MRIVILTVNHLYANKVVKDILSKYKGDVKLIVESDCLLYNKSLFNSLKKYLKVSGIYYVIAQALKLELFKYLTLISNNSENFLNSKFYSFKKVALKLKIPVKKVFNINSKEGLRLLKRSRPDLIISVLFNQILGGEVIKLSKSGVINMHPAYLPDYKGVSPVFWALSNSEKQVGVSVHYINQGIDTGQILARRKVPVEKLDTEDSLYWKLVKVGSPILLDVIEKIKSGKKLAKIINLGGRYFSLPTVEAVRKYLKKRKTFFRFKDLIYQS